MCMLLTVVTFLSGFFRTVRSCPLLLLPVSVLSVLLPLFSLLRLTLLQITLLICHCITLSRLSRSSIKVGNSSALFLQRVLSVFFTVVVLRHYFIVLVSRANTRL